MKKQQRRKRELLNLRLSMSTIAPKLDRGKKSDGRITKPNLPEPPEPSISFGHYLNQQRLSRYPLLRQQYFHLNENRRIADCESLAFPPEVEELVPEAKFYGQLRKLEESIDSVCKVKQQDLEELETQPPPKIRTMLLLSIYNLHYNQINPYTISDSTIKVPAWALRIQGRALCPHLDSFVGLDTEKSFIRMTHFIKKIEVMCDKEEFPVIEWDRESFEEEIMEHNGFEIVREGDKEIELTVSIWIDYSPKQFKVCRELSSLIGIRQCTRTQAVTALWHYIKYHKLQDLNERKIIHCNKELGALVKAKTMCFSEIMGRMKEWLEDLEPYKITYKIK